MEDEHGGVGRSGGVVSDSPVSGDLPVVGNTDIDNQVEESYEEGEIMVEIVGSDVFVDGISGDHKEAEFVSEEIGDCKNIEVSPNENVSGEVDVNPIGDNELGFSELRDGKNYAVTKEVDDVTLSESVSALSSRDVSVWNTGIESMVVSSSVETTSVVVSEETTVITEVIGNDCAEKEEVLLPSSDNSLSLGADSLTFEEANKEARGVETETVPSELSSNPNCEDSENVKVDEDDSVVRGELSGADVAKDGSFRDNVGLTRGDGDCVVEEKEVLANESKDSVLETDALVSAELNQESDGVCDEISVDGEIGEGVDEDFDDVMDSEDGTSDINPPDVNLGNDESLLETDVVDRNQVVSDEPPHLADESDTATVNKDEVTNSDTGDNQNNTARPISPQDEEIVQADSDIHAEEHVIATTVMGVVDGENVEIPAVDASTENIQFLEEGDKTVLEDSDMIEDQPVIAATVSQVTDNQKEMEVVDGGGQGEMMDFEISEQSLEASTETMQLLEQEVEAADVSVTEANVDSIETNGFYIEEDHTSETELTDADLATENSKISHEVRMNLSGYFSPSDNEGIFGSSDLVWGKVRSHPWWPGQIFDPEDASDNAVKYYKKDSYLVAYFGDRTFAWNDASVLRPFRSFFPQIEKQSNSEAFQIAVECALEEVSRRVELGLACSCISKDAAYAEIEAQVVENTGIREESSKRYGVDRSSGAHCFEPDKLVDYVRKLAPNSSSCGADRLDLAVAQSQLSAFYRFKGYRPITDFPPIGELLEISDQLVAPKGEFTGEMEYSVDAAEDDESAAGKKRKLIDPFADVADKRVNTHTSEKISTPKPSFKIGECIRRVASQLTGATSSSVVVKGSVGEESISPKIYEHSEMLSKLQILAQNPKKNHTFINPIRNFFMGFRSSIALNKRGRKKKVDSAVGGSGEEFEFDDVNDSYWTDRIVHNYPEEQLIINNSNNNAANGVGNFQLVPFDAEKSGKSTRKPNSRKRYSTGNYPTEMNEIDEAIKRRKQETSPAELILHFAERKYVPSEINMNKMFRRFGPLMESETEVDHETGCAKVIFKRGSDAEVARNSSEKFGIFGPILVNYQIGYSPLISVKVLPVEVEMPQYQDDMELMM